MKAFLDASGRARALPRWNKPDAIWSLASRLIASVVTGKLDVREAAATLPEEPAELELLNMGDALADGDEGSEDQGLEAVLEARARALAARS